MDTDVPNITSFGRPHRFEGWRDTKPFVTGRVMTPEELACDCGCLSIPRQPLPLDDLVYFLAPSPAEEMVRQLLNNVAAGVRRDEDNAVRRLVAKTPDDQRGIHVTRTGRMADGEIRFTTTAARSDDVPPGTIKHSDTFASEPAHGA